MLNLFINEVFSLLMYLDSMNFKTVMLLMLHGLMTVFKFKHKLYFATCLAY